MAATTGQNFHFKPHSENGKLGGMPATTSDSKTCPTTCGAYDVCYAKTGPQSWHWKKVDNGERGGEWEQMLGGIQSIASGAIWRHNVSGDLPHVDGMIDAASLDQLIRANKRKKGFTYTHHARTAENLALVAGSNAKGFTINLSCDTAKEAAIVKTENPRLPVVTLLPMDAPNVQEIDGQKIVACPAEKTDKIQCSNCQLCAMPDREYIIGFRAHGQRKKSADIIARG